MRTISFSRGSSQPRGSNPGLLNCRQIPLGKPLHFSSLFPKTSMFTLAIFCLTTSSLLSFTDLTFQVPMQNYSLQDRTLLPSPVTSTAGCCFWFGFTSSFFLELFVHWSPIACWAPTDLGSSSFCILSFCLFMLFMGFSRQEYWSGVPLPSPVDYILFI